MSWFSFRDMRLRRKIMVITVISTLVALVMAWIGRLNMRTSAGIQRQIDALDAATAG